MALAKEFYPSGVEGKKRARNVLLTTVDKPQFTVTFTLRDVSTDVWGSKKAAYGVEGRGYNEHDFDVLEVYCFIQGLDYDRVVLNDLLPAELRAQSEHAELFIIPNGINIMAKNPRAADEIFAAFVETRFDTHVINHKRHCNRLAQQVCKLVDGKQQDPVDGIGSTHDMRHFANGHITTIKHTLADLLAMPELLDETSECNLYTNTTLEPDKSGVGWHEDKESKRVCAGRCGASMNLSFQWVQYYEPVGERFCVTLHHGCLYFMSLKAVGPGPKPSQLCLKHAAGGPAWSISNKEWLTKRAKAKLKRTTK